LRRQVAANRKCPRRFRHTLDVLPVVDPDAARLCALLMRLTYAPY
jgi:hypothetical protein